MSKERLEEIENKLLQATNEDDEDVVYASICAEAVLEDLQWTVGYAKKQAERAETLEMKYESSGSMFNRQNMQARIDELEHQNQKYREADEGEFLDNLIGRLYEYENQIIRYRKVLEFYADEDNYKEFYDLMRGRNVVMVLEDDGIKAHEALESENNE